MTRLGLASAARKRGCEGKGLTLHPRLNDEHGTADLKMPLRACGTRRSCAGRHTAA